MEDLSGTARVILGMLRTTDRTGYDIKQLVDKSTRFFWAASYGQIYPELRRLERDGLIRGEEDPSGGRRRKIYSLTDAGERALVDWLESDAPLVYELREEALLKLFFAIDDDELLRHLRAMREHHEAVAARLREIEPDARAADRPGAYTVLRFGIEHQMWVADYCRALEEQLQPVEV